MSGLRKNFGRKLVGDKTYHYNRQYETLLNAGLIDLEEEEPSVKIVTSPNYTTNGEEFIVIKDTPLSTITLNSNTTEHIIIKALTKVTIIPDKGAIDEDWDEVNIDRGACVEFYYIDGNWYIGSSDGIKLA